MGRGVTEGHPFLAQGFDELESAPLAGTRDAFYCLDLEGGSLVQTNVISGNSVICGYLV